MKYWVLDQIFNKSTPERKLEYLEVDGNFNILDTSEQVQRFADCPDEVKLGNDVRIGFPELIGVEDTLSAVLEGRQERFELNGIARSSADSALYIDLYVIADEYENLEESRLILFLEDVTEKMVLEQSLVQRVNEANLLMSALSDSKNYINKVITSMADALIVTTKSGNIKTINQAAIDLFGYD